MERIIIDGSLGEGGGQVLRSSLTLAALYKVSVEIINIRAKRSKPGLLRQHLTCVKAAQQVCNAKVNGDELGSQRIVFTPGRIEAGEYHFAIGTAGSTSLVCQTVLPLLAVVEGESTITFEGGTHNKAAPSLTFMQNSYFPVLEAMGVNTEVTVERFGFYPAGGGKWSIRVIPTGHISSFSYTESQVKPSNLVLHLNIKALVSKLPDSIGYREVRKVKKLLDLHEFEAEVEQVESQGPGNILMLDVVQGSYRSQFDVVGELGLSADNVAKRAVGRMMKFLKSGAAVEEHLADQLLVLAVLAGEGCYSTTKPSLHTTTNIEVISLFGRVRIDVQQQNDNCWRIALKEKKNEAV